MLDFAWSEIALVGVVALIAIGPKDMPVAIRAVAAMVKKARRMAAELQTHVDDMVREADLQDVRDDFNSLRRMDLRAGAERMLDPEGAVRRTLRDSPRPAPPLPQPPAPAEAPAAIPAAEPPAVLPAAEVESRPEHPIPPPHAAGPPATESRA